MNTILMWAVAVSAILGGLDKIFGDRFGLGERFDEGFRLTGPMFSGMLGILCLSPVLSRILTAYAAPLLLQIGLDPSILAGIIPIDMGGYQLAAGMAADPVIGIFSAVIPTSTFGCTLMFTIPVGLGLIDERKREPFILGILYGLIFLPVPFLLGGVLGGLSFRQTIFQSLPALVLTLILSYGILKNPAKIASVFMILSKGILALSVLGILAALTEYLCGITLIPGILPLREALTEAGLCAILLIGCLPFAEILHRLLKRPLRMIGDHIGLRDRGITGMLMGLVSVTAVLGSMPDMEDREISINAAFLVSAAAVFGPHLSVCAANAPAMVMPLVIAKLSGGLCAVIFMILQSRKKNRQTAL